MIDAVEEEQEVLEVMRSFKAALLQHLGLLERRSSLARFADRLTSTANKSLCTIGSGPISMTDPYKYLPTSTANDHLRARTSTYNNSGETGTRAKTQREEGPVSNI